MEAGREGMMESRAAETTAEASCLRRVEAGKGENLAPVPSGRVGSSRTGRRRRSDRGWEGVGALSAGPQLPAPGPRPESPPAPGPPPPAHRRSQPMSPSEAEGRLGTRASSPDAPPAIPRSASGRSPAGPRDQLIHGGRGLLAGAGLQGGRG